jgi:hypothetical protein
VLLTISIGDGPDGVGVTDVAFTPTYTQHHPYVVLPVAQTLDAGGTPTASSAALGASWERTVEVILSLDGGAIGVHPDKSPVAAA